MLIRIWWYSIIFLQCATGGSGPYCCKNGADNPDCCENGGKGKYCCTNGQNVPGCATPTRTATTTRATPVSTYLPPVEKQAVSRFSILKSDVLNLN